MESSQKRKREESDCYEEQVGATLLSVARQWTLDRNQRAANGTKKVRSAEDGPLMGGDWVLNKEGGGATLSFCFENPDGECYGLTVGHLVKSVGSSIFGFAESEPILVPDDEIDKEEYFVFEIGEVTSISAETDSLVFKMDLEKGQYDPMRIALSGQSHVTLNKNLLSLAKTPTAGSASVGFGAQRRGAKCIVLIPSSPSPGQHSFTGDIGLESASDATDAATDGGDCGTIFCSMENGAPAYFHHVLAYFSDGTKISYGVPLLKILDAHEETRHLVSALNEDRKSAPGDKKAKSYPYPQGEAYEVAGLRQFQTRVVDRPSDALLKVDSSSKEVDSAALRLNTDGDDRTEDQTLPVFNVRVKAKKPTLRDE